MDDESKIICIGNGRIFLVGKAQDPVEYFMSSGQAEPGPPAEDDGDAPIIVEG